MNRVGVVPSEVVSLAGLDVTNEEDAWFAENGVYTVIHRDNVHNPIAFHVFQLEVGAIGFGLYHQPPTIAGGNPEVKLIESDSEASLNVLTQRDNASGDGRRPFSSFNGFLNINDAKNDILV